MIDARAEAEWEPDLVETALSDTVGPRVRPSRKHAGWAGLVALLTAEVLGLTLRFDAQALVDSGAWWGPVVASARFLPQALMALAAAALVFGGWKWSAGPRRSSTVASGAVASAAPTRSRSWGWGWGFLAAHLVAFGLLAALTQAVWEGPLGRSPLAPAWVAIWLATGLLSLALWAVAAQPLNAWAAQWRRARASGVLAAAVAVGAGACLAGQVTGTFWQPMSTATLWSVRVVLGLVFSDVIFRPAEAVVGARGFAVEVAPSCSGSEGIGLIWAFLAVYLLFFRRELRFPQALGLVPLGTVVMWLANVTRIATLVTIGATVSPEIALGGFHSQAGWLTFNAVALGLVLLSRRARLFAVADGPGPPAAAVSPTAAYLGPLLALVATVMVTSALSPSTGFDALYPARVLAVAAALWVLRIRSGRDEPLGEGSRPGGFWSATALAIGLVVFAIWIALEPTGRGSAATGDGLAEGLARLPRGLAAAWLVFRVVGSVVTVPIAEELAFRGYLTRRLIAADFTRVPPGRLTWLSFVVSSVLFGVLHGRWLAGTIAGMLYALAYARRGRLSDAILAHAFTNALIAAAVLATGAWSLWN